MPWGRDQLAAIAADLCGAGLAVWNLGYRRVGTGGHPWPATLEDVAAALDCHSGLQGAHHLDRTRLSLVGHSAGGHLAFWAARQALRLTPPITVRAAVGLAPLLDLAAASKASLGGGAVDRFLGGTVDAVPDRYQLASPRAQLPLGVRQFIVHGEADTEVPPRFSRAYVAAATAAGDDVTYQELRGVDHMAFVDPATGAYGRLRRYLLSAA
jgi:acetyl esterase/lipase